MGVIELTSLVAELTAIAGTVVKWKRDDGTRARLAELLIQVSDCVLTIGANIASGKTSAAQCGELSVYVQHLHALLANATDQKTADRLVFWLKHVEAVPGYAEVEISRRIQFAVEPSWWNSKRIEQSAEVKKIAGILRGIANIVRA